MSKSMNLNKLQMIEYVVKSPGNLEKLMDALSYVPVNLNEKYKSHNCYFDDLEVRTYLFQPETRQMFLDECVYSYDEADVITEKTIMPYPVVHFCSRGMSDHYHEKNNLKEMFYPTESGRILSPISLKHGEKNTNGIIVLWPEQGQAISRRKLHYLEMFLDKEFNF